MSDEKMASPSTIHIMVDIETFGILAAENPVICLGAIRFSFEDAQNIAIDRVIGAIDAHSVCDEHMFFQIYNLEDQLNEHKRINVDTMAWWMRSPNQVKMLNNWLQSNHNQQLLPAKLQNLTSWLDGLRADGSDIMLWSYGIFDVAFIQEMYRSAGMAFPLHYRSLADVRSVKRLYECTKNVKLEKDAQNEYAHHPLMDCYQQIQAMRQIIANLR